EPGCERARTWRSSCAGRLLADRRTPWNGPGGSRGTDHTSLRTDEEHRRRLAAELAGPRATARLLALLPLVGIAMGQALDAEPLRMLLTTPWGRLALVAGISLEVCGTWWVNRIANTVERSL